MLVFRKKWMLTPFVNPEMYLIGKNVFVRSTGSVGKKLEKVTLKNYEKDWGDLRNTLHKIREIPLTLEGV